MDEEFEERWKNIIEEINEIESKQSESFKIYYEKSEGLKKIMKQMRREKLIYDKLLNQVEFVFVERMTNDSWIVFRSNHEDWDVLKKWESMIIDIFDIYPHGSIVLEKTDDEIDDLITLWCDDGTIYINFSTINTSMMIKNLLEKYSININPDGMTNLITHKEMELDMIKKITEMFVKGDINNEK